MLGAIGASATGLTNAYARLDASARDAVRPDGDQVQSTVMLKQASVAVKANAAVFRAVSETEKRLLDVLA